MVDAAAAVVGVVVPTLLAMCVVWAVAWVDLHLTEEAVVVLVAMLVTAVVLLLTGVETAVAMAVLLPHMVVVTEAVVMAVAAVEAAVAAAGAVVAANWCRGGAVDWYRRQGPAACGWSVSPWSR